jgi:Ser/Thr protein kinase RdoA (MazF antagonist)
LTDGHDHEHILELARTAIPQYGLSPDTTVELCNVSENHTYDVKDPATEKRYALRVHRPGYRDANQIESELIWMDALRDDGVIETPPVVRAADGGRVASVTTRELGNRNVVLFEWLPGLQPDPDDAETAAAAFETLGAISARMHAHAKGWSPPPGFDRPPWDYDHSIGRHGHWGRWQDGLGIGREESAHLERLADTIERRLAGFGQEPDRFGLVHADIRLANLLVDGGEVRVIDFDDCGFSWFMYDFATAVSFMEDHPSVPELREAWLSGYRSVTPLDQASANELQTFVMLRRLLLVAWIGSHHQFATEAAQLGAGFTDGTCALAEEYLSTHS